MAVREFELESALRAIQGNSVSPYDAYVLGMMKAQSPQDFKQNLDSLNSLKQLVSQFDIPQHDNTALLQALLKDDIHSLLRTLSRYLLRSQVSTYQSVQPVQSVSVRPASPVHSVVSTILQNNSQSQARTIPSSSIQTSIPAIYSQAGSSQSTLPSQSALPTHQSVSYSRPSQPSNPSVTQMLRCERCNSMNPINDGLIRCSCGNRYCHICHQETSTCICNAALVRRIQAKNS